MIWLRMLVNPVPIFHSHLKCFGATMVKKFMSFRFLKTEKIRAGKDRARLTIGTFGDTTYSLLLTNLYGFSLLFIAERENRSAGEG